MLSASKRTTEQLSTFLAPLTVDEVNEIVLGKRGAKAHEQQIIAAFIQKHPREIFTDLRATA